MITYDFPKYYVSEDLITEGYHIIYQRVWNHQRYKILTNIHDDKKMLNVSNVKKVIINYIDIEY